MTLEIFIPMKIPTVTHQQKKVHVVNGKPVFYEPDELKDARAKLTAHLARYAPHKPFEGGVRLTVKWLFPKGKHEDGQYKLTRPDTDNLIKLLKDVMTCCGFWKDDAQVCSEINEKFYAKNVGLYVRIDEV